MTSWWTVGAVVLAVVSVADAAEPGQPPSIRLQMLSDSKVSDEVLQRSQAEVTRIFAGAGVTVLWTDAEPRFTVKIVPQVLGYSTAGSPVMGVAIRKPHGSTAQIFLKQVQDFARVHRIDVSSMLACVIAHEIGHLLLGIAHSATGLMQAGWDRTLVHDAVRGALTFTEAQAEKIRAIR